MRKEKAFLGAGSPSHPDGDSSVSPMGIIQQHAYSILDVKQVDNLKMIKLRNPHGEGEWTGDWSDDSPLWNKRMRNMLDYHQSEDDGVFWMELNAFMSEYEMVYICRAFDKGAGWNSVMANDRWVGKSAAGLPSKTNRSCVYSENPQYCITVNTPGPAYLVFRLNERVSQQKAKLSGHINVQNNDGDIITRPKGANQIAWANPKNQAVRSIEIDLKSSYTYPL